MSKLYEHPETVRVWLRWNDQDQQPDPWEAYARCELLELIPMAILAFNIWPPEETGLEPFTINVQIDPDAKRFETWSYQEEMGGWHSEWGWDVESLEEWPDLDNALSEDPKAVFEEYCKLRGGLVEVASEDAT